MEPVVGHLFLRIGTHAVYVSGHAHLLVNSTVGSQR